MVLNHTSLDKYKKIKLIKRGKIEILKYSAFCKYVKEIIFRYMKTKSLATYDITKEL